MRSLVCGSRQSGLADLRLLLLTSFTSYFLLSALTLPERQSCLMSSKVTAPRFRGRQDVCAPVLLDAVNIAAENYDMHRRLAPQIRERKRTTATPKQNRAESVDIDPLKLQLLRVGC